MGLCIGLGFLFYSQSRLLGEVQSSSNEEPHQISVLAPTAGRVFVWSTASASCVEALPDRGVTSVSKNACKCFISLLSVLRSHQGYAGQWPTITRINLRSDSWPHFRRYLDTGVVSTDRSINRFWSITHFFRSCVGPGCSPFILGLLTSVMISPRPKPCPVFVCFLLYICVSVSPCKLYNWESRP